MLRVASLRQFNSLSLAVLLLACQVTPSLAQTNVSIFQKLAEYEQILFGKQESKLSIEKRLQNLEKVLFGKSSDESTAARIGAIEKVMSGKGGSEYLPPVAPQMDRSEFAPEPKQAPDKALANDAGEQTPLPASSQERVKGLLRQAMQSYSQGKTTEAERLYQKVLASDFRNVDANYNLGAIAENRGDLQAAGRYYETALKGNPSDLEIQDAFNAVQNKLKTTTAKAPSPDLPLDGAPATAGEKVIAQEAAEAYKRGNFDDAIEKLSYLAKKNPFDANTQFALGQAYRGKGKNSQAARHLRSAATLNPKNDLYVKTLNDLQSQMDEQEGAIASNNQRSGSQDNEVLPFSGLPDSNSVSSNASNLAAVEEYLRRNTGGGVMIGSVTSYGNPGGAFWGSSMSGGFPAVLGTAPGGTRLRRAVSSSLTGAAIGAMSNRGNPGGMSRGAMRGAMYGGLFGLMLGGY